MRKYKAVSKLDNSEVSFDYEEWAQSAIEEGWIDGYKPYEYIEPPVSAPTPEELRQEAYREEVDPLFAQAQYYHAEAEGLRLLDRVTEAAAAEETAREYLRQYAEKKIEIRERFPDDEAERYRLASSGTYHMQSCSYASESAELLTLDEIRERGNGKPCSRCKPPALAEE